MSHGKGVVRLGCPRRSVLPGPAGLAGRGVVRGARRAEEGGRDAEHRNEETGRRRMKALIPTLSHRGREKSGDVERPGGNSNAWASDPGDEEKVVGWRRRQVASPGPSPSSGREGSGGPEGEGGAEEQD